MMRALRLVAVPIDSNGNVTFQQTLRCMVHRVYKEDDISPELMAFLDQKLPKQKGPQNASTSALLRASRTVFTTDEYFAAQYCQSVVRGYLKRKRDARREKKK